jgi:hypothetical protein
MPSRNPLTLVKEMEDSFIMGSFGISQAFFALNLDYFTFSLGYLILVLLFVPFVSYDFPRRGFVIAGFRQGVGLSCQFLDFVDSFVFDF